MDDVKRCKHDRNFCMECHAPAAGAISTGHPDAGRVYAAAYEAVKKDYDAQRLRVDTAEAELKREREFNAVNVSEAERMLAAAEQRIADHESMLRHFASCADLFQVGTMAMNYVAALNPKPEAGSHE